MKIMVKVHMSDSMNKFIGPVLLLQLLLAALMYSITVCARHRRLQHHYDGCDSADDEGAYASKHGDDA
jgi:hypothetical protein